jgi:hypothetical protein
MREWQSAIYWAVAGALMAFGGLALFTVGLPFLFAGVVMAIIAMTKLWIKGAWAITLGLGGVPMALAAGLVGHEGASSGSSFSTDQIVVLAFFGVIALSGIAFRLMARGRHP